MLAGTGLICNPEVKISFLIRPVLQSSGSVARQDSHVFFLKTPIDHRQVWNPTFENSLKWVISRMIHPIYKLEANSQTHRKVNEQF